MTRPAQISKFEADVLIYNAVLDTVQTLTTVLPYDADQLNELICDAGLHRELMTLAIPNSDDYDIGDFAAASDEFDGDLFDRIQAGVEGQTPVPDTKQKDQRIISLREANANTSTN